jgi:hypothetical protein
VCVCHSQRTPVALRGVLRWKRPVKAARDHPGGGGRRKSQAARGPEEERRGGGGVMKAAYMIYRRSPGRWPLNEVGMRPAVSWVAYCHCLFSLAVFLCAAQQGASKTLLFTTEFSAKAVRATRVPVGPVRRLALPKAQGAAGADTYWYTTSMAGHLQAQVL